MHYIAFKYLCSIREFQNSLNNEVYISPNMLAYPIILITMFDAGLHAHERNAGVIHILDCMLPGVQVTAGLGFFLHSIV